MRTILIYIGHRLLTFSENVGQMLRLLVETIYWCKQTFRNLDKIFPLMGRIGADSLPIASFTALFIGMVLALQTGYTLQKFGMEASLGSIVSVVMCRELGPVLTALLLAGRIGAGITAEIGTMSVSEEVDALRTLGINPVRYLSMPRFLACVFMLPVLVIYADVVGIFGGGVVSSTYFDVPFSLYFDKMAESLDFMEVFKGLVKSSMFGAIISIVGCHHGLKTTGGPGEVGTATTNSVVFSFVTIYIFDYFFTRLWL